MKIGLRVEEPSWIEVDRADDVHGADRQLKGLIEAKKRPTIVLVMLGNERQYKSFKSMCYSNNIISQCGRYQNFGKGINMSVASNELMQINSKLSGDLYQLMFSQNISPKTMIISIYVCHADPMSILGFCATINQTRS